jgi:hypothetical protein
MLKWRLCKTSYPHTGKATCVTEVSEATPLPVRVGVGSSLCDIV